MVLSEIMDSILTYLDSDSSEEDLESNDFFGLSVKESNIPVCSTFDDAKNKLYSSSGDTHTEFWTNGTSFIPDESWDRMYNSSEIIRKPTIDNECGVTIYNLLSDRTNEECRFVKAHNKVVNQIDWCANNPFLLLSASADGYANILKLKNKKDISILQKFQCTSTSSVTCAKWSSDKEHIICSDYTGSSKLFHVETGSTVSTFTSGDPVTSLLLLHDSHCFATGSLNNIHVWDLRCSEGSSRDLTHYKKFGRIVDMTMDSTGSFIFSCSDMLERNSSDRGVMAWDYKSGQVVSNQIYNEPYLCTGVRPLKSGRILLQTNRDSVESFSERKPFKHYSNRALLGGHSSHGYRVGFDVDVDRSLVYCGSADGSVAVYDYWLKSMVDALRLPRIGSELLVTSDVKAHPRWNFLVSCGTWDGHIVVWNNKKF